MRLSTRMWCWHQRGGHHAHTLGVGTHADGTCGAAITCSADTNKIKEAQSAKAKEAHNTKAGDMHFTEVKKARCAKVGEAGAKGGVTDVMVCETNIKASKADNKVSKVDNNAGKADARVREADAEVDSVTARQPLTHYNACSTNKHAQRRQAGQCSRWTSPAWHFGAEEANRKSAARWQKGKVRFC